MFSSLQAMMMVMVLGIQGTFTPMHRDTLLVFWWNYAAIWILWLIFDAAYHFAKPIPFSIVKFLFHKVIASRYPASCSAKTVGGSKAAPKNRRFYSDDRNFEWESYVYKQFDKVWKMKFAKFLTKRPKKRTLAPSVYYGYYLQWKFIPSRRKKETTMNYH